MKLTISRFEKSDFMFTIAMFLSFKSLIFSSSISECLTIVILLSFLFADKYIASKKVNEELIERLTDFEKKVQELKDDLKRTKESSEIYKMSASIGSQGLGGKRG